MVKVQHSRSRDLNRILARKRLAEKIDLVEKGEDSWLQQRQVVRAKRKAKASQKSRSKYRTLAEEKSKAKESVHTTVTRDTGRGASYESAGKGVNAAHDLDETINPGGNGSEKS